MSFGKSYEHSFNTPVLSQRKNKSNHIKIVIVGDSSVGKSSLVKQIAYNKFPKNTSSTIGASYSTFPYTQNGAIYKFQMWDTARQERYKSLIPMYLNDSKIVLIVFDITCRVSFDEVKEYWFNNVMDEVPDTFKILIGAKLDLNKIRTVSTSEASNFAKDNNMEYIECSSKTSDNISKIKNMIVKTGIDIISSNNNNNNNNTVILDEMTLGKKFKSNCVNGPKCYTF